MKINWGHKLVFFAACFMLFILGMVYYISGQKIDLVESDYYERGIRYQEELDKNLAKDGREYQFAYNAGEHTLKLQFDSETSGKVLFYRPANSKMDFELPMLTDANSAFVYNTSAMAKGLWKMKAEWKQKGKTSVAEKDIFIQ